METKPDQHLTQIIAYYQERGAARDHTELAALLREIQDLFGCVPQHAQQQVAQTLGIGLSVVASIVKLYPSLKGEASRHTLTVCVGPRCAAKGALAILDEAQRLLGIPVGGTTPDGRFTLRTQNCMHQCAGSANLTVDGDHFPYAAAGDLPAILKKYV